MLKRPLAYRLSEKQYRQHRGNMPCIIIVCKNAYTDKRMRTLKENSLLSFALNKQVINQTQEKNTAINRA